MRQGSGAAMAVFGGVLALAAGIGWLLYEAGKNVDGAGVGEAPKPTKKKGGRSEVRFVEPERIGPPKAKPPSRPDVRFEIPGHDDLRERNWREVAIAFTEMAEMSQEFRRTGPPDPSSEADAEKMKRMNAVTDRYRAYVIESPIGFGEPPPDQDPSQAKPMPTITPVDHPAFVVNLVAVLVDRAEAPLTEEQSKRMLEAGLKHSEIRDRPPTPQTPDAYRLESILAQGTMADAFYADLFSILTT